MADIRMICELDFELPTAARFAEIAADWLDRGSLELAGAYRQTMDDGPPLVAGSARRSGPCGPPGSVWGFISLSRDRRRSSRVYSVKNLSWLRKQLADPPTEATLGVYVLDQSGYPGEAPLRIQVERDTDAPDWVRLSALAPERKLKEPQAQRRWLELMRTVADMVNPSFGHIDYEYELGKTALEATAGPPWRMPRETIPTSRQLLRGYAWLTICPQELAHRLGGVPALRASSAFHQVEQLETGGIWLRATEDYRDYDQAAFERIFEVLAPVLPTGMPLRTRS